MKWLREAISDQDGVADVAYISVFVVAGAVLGAIIFVCLLTAIAYIRCTEVLAINPPVLCRFDPAPLGTAIGLICGGFATAIGALAGYMAATRRAPRNHEE
jgi:hypothetical protein